MGAIVYVTCNPTSNLSWKLCMDMARRLSDLAGGGFTPKAGQKDPKVARHQRLRLRFVSRVKARRYCDLVDQMPLMMGLTAKWEPTSFRLRLAKARLASAER